MAAIGKNGNSTRHDAGSITAVQTEPTQHFMRQVTEKFCNNGGDTTSVLLDSCLLYMIFSIRFLHFLENPFSVQSLSSREEVEEEVILLLIGLCATSDLWQPTSS